MTLHFTISTSEIKEIRFTIGRVASFDYDSIHHKLTIEVGNYFTVDCLPDALRWMDFNCSCTEDTLIFYNIVELHCEDDNWVDFDTPEPFDWEDFEDPDDPHPDDPDYEDIDFPF